MGGLERPRNTEVSRWFECVFEGEITRARR